MPPIFQNSLFVSPDSETFVKRGAAGSGVYDYTRVANPTTDILQAKLAALDTADDRFHVHDRQVYWWRSGQYSDSPLSGSGRFEKLLGAPTTVRNTTTVQKLAGKYPPRP